MSPLLLLDYCKVSATQILNHVAFFEPFLRVSEKEIYITPALKCPLRKTTSIPYIS